jgi:2-keto-4-pentenoate hydratase
MVGRLREQRGEKVIGYKVGCTSKTIQEQLGVEGPIFGRIFDTGCFRSPARLSHGRYCHLAVEGELAVRLSKDLHGDSPSAEECCKAIAAVFPVIELHHYIIPRAWGAVQWLIASNGMHAGFVSAEAGPDRSGLANDVRSLSIHINEVMVGIAGDPASLICPIESVRWLAGRLAQLGLQLRKGQVVLTGSPLKLFPVAPGSRIVVEAPPLGASCVEIDP